MKIQPIRNDKDHEAAVERVQGLWQAQPGTRDHDELEVLAVLIDAYEEERHAIAPPDPVEAIRFHMEQGGRNQQDLAVLLGSVSRASEVLGRRRSLTMAMVRKLHRAWRIPLESLIGEYPLDRSAAE